jgi:hypothetical protein
VIHARHFSCTPINDFKRGKMHVTWKGSQRLPSLNYLPEFLDTLFPIGFSRSRPTFVLEKRTPTLHVLTPPLAEFRKSHFIYLAITGELRVAAQCLRIWVLLLKKGICRNRWTLAIMEVSGSALCLPFRVVSQHVPH